MLPRSRDHLEPENRLPIAAAKRVRIVGRDDESVRDLTDRRWRRTAHRAVLRRAPIFFPTTRTGFAVLREYRSRVLSSSRRHESMVGTDIHQGWEYGTRSIKTRARMQTFSGWLEPRKSHGNAGILRFFTPSGESAPSCIKPAAEARRIRQLLDAEARHWPEWPCHGSPRHGSMPSRKFSLR